MIYTSGYIPYSNIPLFQAVAEEGAEEVEALAEVEEVDLAVAVDEAEEEDLAEAEEVDLAAAVEEAVSVEVVLDEAVVVVEEDLRDISFILLKLGYIFYSLPLLFFCY